MEKQQKKEPYGAITFMDGTEKDVYSEAELWEDQDKPVALRAYY
uniref:Uncharacterized protein n=1 Tax=Siphoviridae sp. ct1SN28 TaxID=2825308 RepID=A0A8S5TRM4_9CAUD|nr:MAG TPA: hypothetical protein [Siphoviridae sp. ct1SN28]